MNYQDIIAIIIVTIAVLYTIYATIKSIRKKSNKICDDDACCGCSVKKELNNLPKVKEFQQQNCKH